MDSRTPDNLLCGWKRTRSPDMNSVVSIRIATLALLLVTARVAAMEGAGGIVRAVNGGIASVDFAGPSPKVGDKAEFFFEMDGVEGVVTVATGTVLSLDGKGSMKIKIEQATGEVAKDHLVRFAKPGAEPTASPMAAPRSDRLQ